MQELDKKSFQGAKKLNSKDWIKSNITKSSIYQEDGLHDLPKHYKKGQKKHKLNGIGINKVGNFMNISNEDIVFKEILLNLITPWMMR